MYVFEAVEGVILWDLEMNGIMWTSESVYPYLYRFSDGEWLFYDEGSDNPRWFNVLSSGVWESY
jgi:hypothetical protein